MQVRNVLKNLWPIAKADNIGKFDSFPHKDKKVYGLYHIYCVNEWKSLVVEQLDAIKNSGLMETTDMLFVSCIYVNESDLAELTEILAAYALSYKIISSLSKDNNKFEFPALQFVYDLSFKEDFYVYYFHTKGVSYTKDSAVKYPNTKFEQLSRCSAAWRKMMEHFIFTKYNVAMNVLRTYDAYGCKYDDPIVPPYHYKYYAGNFWWSKSSYIKTLPPITDEEQKNRYWAENWLLLKTEKIFSPFNTPVELYAVEIPKCVYTSKILGGQDVIKYLKFVFGHYCYIMKKLMKR